MSLPTDSQARKKIPMFSGLIKYFPDALAAVAEHSFESNEKHNPGEPLHWSREKSADHMDCIVRHTTDIATGADKIAELKAMAWRTLAELQLTIEAANVQASEPVYDPRYVRHELWKMTAGDAPSWTCDCGHVFTTYIEFIQHQRSSAPTPSRLR